MGFGPVGFRSPFCSVPTQLHSLFGVTGQKGWDAVLGHGDPSSFSPNPTEWPPHTTETPSHLPAPLCAFSAPNYSRVPQLMEIPHLGGGAVGHIPQWGHSPIGGPHCCPLTPKQLGGGGIPLYSFLSLTYLVWGRGGAHSPPPIQPHFSPPHQTPLLFSPYSSPHTKLFAPPVPLPSGDRMGTELGQPPPKPPLTPPAHPHSPVLGGVLQNGAGGAQLGDTGTCCPLVAARRNCTPSVGKLRHSPPLSPPPPWGRPQPGGSFRATKGGTERHPRVPHRNPMGPPSSSHKYPTRTPWTPPQPPYGLPPLHSGATQHRMGSETPQPPTLTLILTPPHPHPVVPPFGARWDEQSQQVARGGAGWHQRGGGGSGIAVGARGAASPPSGSSTRNVGGRLRPAAPWGERGGGGDRAAPLLAPPPSTPPASPASERLRAKSNGVRCQRHTPVLSCATAPQSGSSAGVSGDGGGGLSRVSRGAGGGDGGG